MLMHNRPLRKILDRFICKLNNFRFVKVDMISMEAIPELSYRKEEDAACFTCVCVCAL